MSVIVSRFIDAGECGYKTRRQMCAGIEELIQHPSNFIITENVRFKKAVD